MDTSRFLEVLSGAAETGVTLENSVREVRRQLEEGDRHTFYEAASGRRYVCSGIRFGVGYAQAAVEVLDDGLVQVSVHGGMRVSKAVEPALRKLLRRYSARMKVRGFVVEEGRMAFRTAPFDPADAPYPIERIVGLALSSVRAYAGVPLALEAGADPWDLLDYDRRDPRGGGGADDGGHEVGRGARTGKAAPPARRAGRRAKDDEACRSCS